jgi:hypothetical protein
MSTAEAVSVGVSAGLDAAYFGAGRLEPGHLARHLAGAIAQGQAEDQERLDAYFDQVVRRRAELSPLWRAFLEGRGGAG